MSLSIGIVGLPNVGKSTLFNALLKKQAALVANYPFATIEPNVGIVEVPDSRLDGLVEVVRNDYGRKMGDREVPQKIIPATVKFVDIAGLVKGAHQGEGLGNEFLGHVREVSALVHVLRDFEDDNIIRSGSVSPKEDMETIETELTLSDLSVLEKILHTAKSEARSKDSEKILKVETLEKIQTALEAGQTARSVILNDKEESSIKDVYLLTKKPIIYVYNVSEENILKTVNIADQEKLYVCAKVEADIASFSEEEQKQYLKELGMEEPGLNRLIKLGYSILGLQTFLTAGPKEVRAWTVRQDAKAPEAAGVIHTDFERGFIGADVISYSKLVELGSYKKAKELGQVRLEGRNYVMKDGDVVEFRFNV